MKTCWKCGSPWLEKHTPGMRAECEKCLSSWHACRNCRFYQDGGRQWCGEPMARDQKPRDAEMANTCEYFQLRDRGETGPAAGADAARRKLAAAFGEAPPANKGRKESGDGSKPGLDEIFKRPD